MKKMKAVLVAAAITASFSGAALAEGSFYGAVDVGQSRLKDACPALPAWWSCKNTDTAFRGSVGYQVNPNWGVEASYGKHGEVKVSGSGITASGTATGFQFSAVGSLPVSDVVALTGKLGVARTEGKFFCLLCTPTPISVSASNTTMAYGIGARYNINKTVAVRAQYEDLGKIKYGNTGPGYKLTILSFGAVFGF